MNFTELEGFLPSVQVLIRPEGTLQGPGVLPAGRQSVSSPATPPSVRIKSIPRAASRKTSGFIAGCGSSLGLSGGSPRDTRLRTPMLFLNSTKNPCTHTESPFAAAEDAHPEDRPHQLPAARFLLQFCPALPLPALGAASPFTSAQ